MFLDLEYYYRTDKFLFEGLQVFLLSYPKDGFYASDFSSKLHEIGLIYDFEIIELIIKGTVVSSSFIVEDDLSIVLKETTRQLGIKHIYYKDIK